jgi:hypothetical protein
MRLVAVMRILQGEASGEFDRRSSSQSGFSTKMDEK